MRPPNLAALVGGQPDDVLLEMNVSEPVEPDPVAARSSPRRPLSHAWLNCDWTPYVIPDRPGFVHYDCPDCLTRVRGLPPERLCPDRVGFALKARDAEIARLAVRSAPSGEPTAEQVEACMGEADAMVDTFADRLGTWMAAPLRTAIARAFATRDAAFVLSRGTNVLLEQADEREAAATARADAAEALLATLRVDRDTAIRDATRAERNTEAAHDILTRAGVPSAVGAACDNPRCTSHLTHRVHGLVGERDAATARADAAEQELRVLREAQNTPIRRTEDAGHRLYRAIIAHLEPHYPEGFRGLDWDVLPGTIKALAKARDEFCKRTLDAEAKLQAGSIADHGCVEDCNGPDAGHEQVFLVWGGSLTCAHNPRSMLGSTVVSGCDKCGAVMETSVPGIPLGQLGQFGRRWIQNAREQE